MRRREIDLDEVRSSPLYRTYLMAWWIAAGGILLLVLTGLLSAANVSPVVLTVLALPGAVLAAGGFLLAIFCTIALLPELGTTDLRQQIVVIRTVLLDIVGLRNRTPD
jgi:hypothetical protein